MNLAKFPRRGYVKEATPIEYLANFSKALGGKVNIYMKRDDLLPGCAGGNKTRKLDFSIADALAQGADTIITCGAVQSNHCRLTLAWAVHEGLDCHLVLEERVPGSYNPEASGNNFLYHLLGVKSITVVPGGSPMMEEMEKVAEKLRAEGKKPYIVPGGASNKIGALGYVSCAQEIMQQMFEMGLNFDHVVVPSGSAGTHAGMIAGFYGNNMDIPMSGIDVSRPGEVQQALVHKLAQATLDYIGAGVQLGEAFARWKQTLLAAFIKLIALPGVFLTLALFLGFQGDQLVALVAMLGLATTPSAYIMAKNMKNDAVLTSGIIVVTTLLSSVTVTGWIFLLRTLGRI